jgi:multiple sugar transport system permease protein
MLADTRRGSKSRTASSRHYSSEKAEIVVGRLLKWLFVVLFVAITAFPFYWMLNLSVRPIEDVLQNPTRLFPTLDQLSQFWVPYRDVLVDFGFLRYIGNSLLISLVTVALTLLLAIPGAYAITRLNFRLKRMMSWGILLVYMFPAIVLAIPVFVVYSKLGLRGNLAGVVVVYMSGTLPVALYMLRSYFHTIPPDLEEAALIDGATRLGTIWRVVLPLSVPAVASVALYTFMIAWNEFLFALLFLLESPNSWTLPLGLQQLNSQEVPKTLLMAGSVIITLPIIVLFLFFERFLTKGLTAGAVKG